MVSPDFQEACEQAFQSNVNHIADIIADGREPHPQTPPELLDAAHRLLEAGEAPSYERANRAAGDRSYPIRV